MEKDFANFIDVKEVIRKVNLTPAGIYARIKTGTFPTGVKIGSARLWKSEEIDAWLEGREKGEV